MLPFSKRFTCLLLHANFALSDVIEFWESTIDICHYLLPFLGVEARVALGDFTDDDPSIELGDVLVQGVRVDGPSGRLLEADRAHVMVVAVVDVSSISRPQPIQQKVVGLVLVGVVSYFHSVLLVHNRGFALYSIFTIQEAEPLNQGVVAGEGPEADVVVRRLEAKNLESLLCRNRLLCADAEG